MSHSDGLIVTISFFVLAAGAGNAGTQCFAGLGFLLGQLGLILVTGAVVVAGFPVIFFAFS